MTRQKNYYAWRRKGVSGKYRLKGFHTHVMVFAEDLLLSVQVSPYLTILPASMVLFIAIPLLPGLIPITIS